jgi:hypothetical protein
MSPIFPPFSDTISRFLPTHRILAAHQPCSTNPHALYSGNAVAAHTFADRPAISHKDVFHQANGCFQNSSASRRCCKTRGLQCQRICKMCALRSILHPWGQTPSIPQSARNTRADSFHSDTGRSILDHPSPDTEFFRIVSDPIFAHAT